MLTGYKRSSPWKRQRSFRPGPSRPTISQTTALIGRSSRRSRAHPSNPGTPMKRPDFLEVFARHRGDIPTITGPGLMTRELFAVTGDDPTILYNMEMPYATPMCLGLAMARPNQRFVALEGDGSLIMALGVLTTIARYRPSNLTVIVLDNESFSTFGAGMTSATATGLDLAAVSR